MKVICGRPHRLLDVCVSKVGELAEHGEKCMLLVPSQYTLQAEVEIMNRLQIEGSFLIDVLSPGRLRTRIFERAGQPERVVIDQRGKCMVISSILDQEAERLKVYGGFKGSRQGLSEKLASMIADFKRSDTTPEELKESLKEMEESSAGKKKLEDLHLIYETYEDKLHGKLADEEDIAKEAQAKLKVSGILNGQHLFVYGFDVITPAFAKDLLLWEEMAESITIFIEADRNGAPDGRLFAPVNASIDRMAAIAAERRILIERERIETELTAPQEIRTLEKSLFALGRKAERENAEYIELSASGTPRAEIHAAASKIRSMLMEGTDPSDIAIVYPKGCGYGVLLSSILPMYDLNVYVAEKRSAAGNPFCRFLLSAFAVVSDGWRTADVIECLQSGFLQIEAEEADALCSYAEGVDLRAEAWKRPFTYIKNGTQEELDALETCRKKIAQPLMSLEKRMAASKNADDAVRAIIALLEETDAYDRLDCMRDELQQQGFEALAQDCAQVWNRVMETLDQLHTILGEEKADAKTIFGLLESGISAMELAALPPVDGAVICGEIGNVRTAEVAILFAVGMNDTGNMGNQGLLTEIEIEEVERATKAYLGMSASQRTALAQLDVLKALSGAKERLLVSFALADETGKALREGDAVSALKQLFPTKQVKGGLAKEDLKPMLTSMKPALQAMAVMLSEAADGKDELSQEAMDVYARLSMDESGREELLEVTRGLARPGRERLTGSQARSLYGRPVMSVSRLETFAQCPYRYFVRYGLSPQEEVRPGVDHAQVGALYHEAAEQFTQMVSKLPGFPAIDEAMCDAAMNEAMKPLIDEWRKSPLGKSERGAAIAAKLEKTARRTGRSIISQYAGGGFRPMNAELVFGQRDLAPITLELPDGTTVYLQGRIDRVDVMEDGHIRVIDYKSGAKKFDPTMAYWGLQLQLMIYLAAALARIPESSAAGFFYCRIADPTIRSESRIKAEIERQIAKKLSLAGISLSDVSVLRAHGESHAAMITKEGKANGRYAGSMVDEEGMKGLLEFAARKAMSLAQDAYCGVIDDAPVEYGQYTACGTCEYAAVCGFDPTRKKNRRLTSKKLEDLICHEPQ